jgi:hypothetical protein
VSEHEVEYWRELAAQYQSQLQSLRERVLRYLASPSPNAAAELVREARGWMEDVADVEQHGELAPADIKTALGDLWKRAGETDR